MDILLPDMNGLEATKKIKENPETREIPVVAVTAYVIGGDRERALAAGCVEFIRKPIDKETFVNQITSYLWHRKEEYHGYEQKSLKPAGLQFWQDELAFLFFATLVPIGCGKEITGKLRTKPTIRR